MTIYKAKRKISDRGSFGVYIGSQPVKRIYKGSQLVYKYESYDPDSVIVDLTNGQSSTITLKKGVYKLWITGGGGTGGTHYIDHYAFTTSGGSGATWEGTIKLASDITLVAYSAGNNEDSYLDFNGSRILTAGGGREATYRHSIRQGGTLTLAGGWSSYVVTTNKSVNGNNGTTSVQIIPNGGVTTSSLKWGEGTKITTSGAVQYGGVKIQYLRYE